MTDSEHHEPTIEFYADPISPYVYIAWHRLAALTTDRPALRVVVRPVLLAALLGHFGQRGPAEIAPKRVFTYKDIVRRRARRASSGRVVAEPARAASRSPGACDSAGGA